MARSVRKNLLRRQMVERREAERRSKLEPLTGQARVSWFDEGGQRVPILGTDPGCDGPEHRSDFRACMWEVFLLGDLFRARTMSCGCRVELLGWVNDR